MNVGSLAEFASTVVYSSQGHIVVQVTYYAQLLLVFDGCHHIFLRCYYLVNTVGATVLFLLCSDCRRCNCVVFSKASFVTALRLRCVVLLTAVAVVLPGVCYVQVVVMSLDITSGERNKTNVLTYVFRYYRL
jgi:hypothetical protein